MLDSAKERLREILSALKPQIEAGVPVVGLEPSCVSVFRDELVSLFPHDQDAVRLSKQTYLLSEYLAKHAPEFEVPKLHRKAIVHGHCHHKSLMGMDDEARLLRQMGLDLELPDSGCCGMAGAFGFEEGDHYDVSIQCGERVLLPAVREAKPDTLIVADGFSCREQIAQTTERRALHVAEVMQLALRDGEATAREYPERLCSPEQPTISAGASQIRTAALVGGGVLLAGAAVWAWKKRAARQE